VNHDHTLRDDEVAGRKDLPEKTIDRLELHLDPNDIQLGDKKQQGSGLIC